MDGNQNPQVYKCRTSRSFFTIARLEVRIDDIPQVRYCLLYLERERWYLVTISKNKEWLLKFGNRFIINMQKAIDCLKYQHFYHLLDLSFLDSIAEKHRIVLLGESVHHPQEGCDIEARIIKHLIKFGYKHVVLEVPKSLTFYCNKFFDRGDAYLYQFLDNEGDLFKKLYEMSLLNDIHVHGIDMEHLPLLPAFWIAESLEKINRVNRERFFSLFSGGKTEKYVFQQRKHCWHT